jgi:hypothetical protein
MTDLCAALTKRRVRLYALWYVYVCERDPGNFDKKTPCGSKGSCVETGYHPTLQALIGSYPLRQASDRLYYVLQTLADAEEALATAEPDAAAAAQAAGAADIASGRSAGGALAAEVLRISIPQLSYKKQTGLGCLRQPTGLRLGQGMHTYMGFHNSCRTLVLQSVRQTCCRALAGPQRVVRRPQHAAGGVGAVGAPQGAQRPVAYQEGEREVADELSACIHA